MLLQFIQYLTILLVMHILSCILFWSVVYWLDSQTVNVNNPELGS